MYAFSMKNANPSYKLIFKFQEYYYSGQDR